MSSKALGWHRSKLDAGKDLRLGTVVGTCEYLPTRQHWAGAGEGGNRTSISMLISLRSIATTPEYLLEYLFERRGVRECVVQYAPVLWIKGFSAPVISNN